MVQGIQSGGRLQTLHSRAANTPGRVNTGLGKPGLHREGARIHQPPWSFEAHFQLQVITGLKRVSTVIGEQQTLRPPAVLRLQFAQLKFKTLLTVALPEHRHPRQGYDLTVNLKGQTDAVCR